MPPGTSMLPVSAQSATRAMEPDMHSRVWSSARPHCKAIGPHSTAMRAASRILAAGTHVISSAFSAGYARAAAAKSSKPYVQFSTNSWS